MTIQCIGQGFDIFQTNLHTFEINGVSYNLNPSSLPDGYNVSAGEASISTDPWSIEYNITKQVLVESDNGTIYKCIIEGDANTLTLILNSGMLYAQNFNTHNYNSIIIIFSSYLYMQT